MTQSVLMSLGQFVFTLGTVPYDTLSRGLEWRHATSDRFGARAASQFTGLGPESISLSGSIVPEIAGSYSALRTLEAMGNSGEAFDLVDGNGNVWGAFTIQKLDCQQNHIIDNGVPRRVDFSLDLSRVA